MATFFPSSVPSASRRVRASSSAWVGWACVPSPAFTIRAPVLRAARYGAPDSGCRSTIVPIPVRSSVRSVSTSDSPLVALLASIGRFTTCAPSAVAASSKLTRVRVEASANANPTTSLGGCQVHARASVPISNLEVDAASSSARVICRRQAGDDGHSDDSPSTAIAGTQQRHRRLADGVGGFWGVAQIGSPWQPAGPLKGLTQYSRASLRTAWEPQGARHHVAPPSSSTIRLHDSSRLVQVFADLSGDRQLARPRSMTPARTPPGCPCSVPRRAHRGPAPLKSTSSTRTTVRPSISGRPVSSSRSGIRDPVPIVALEVMSARRPGGSRPHAARSGRPARASGTPGLRTPPHQVIDSPLRRRSRARSEERDGSRRIQALAFGHATDSARCSQRRRPGPVPGRRTGSAAMVGDRSRRANDLQVRAAGLNSGDGRPIVTATSAVRGE